jgi:uncharacterized protein
MTTSTYRPVRYYTWTYLVTFCLLFAGAYVSRTDANGLFLVFIVPATMTPFAISLVMMLRSRDRTLRKDFWRRIVTLRLIVPGMLPILVLTGPLLVVVSILLSLPFGGSMQQFRISDGFSSVGVMLPGLVMLFLIAAFEELGWRGYAFNSLQARTSNFFKASLLFGVLWSLWHLPLVLVVDTYQYQISHESIWYSLNFFLSVIPLGMLVSWVWLRNGKSIAAAVILHLLVNVSQEALSTTQATKCIESFVLIAVTTAIVLMDRKLFFRRADSAPGSSSLDPDSLLSASVVSE